MPVLPGKMNLGSATEARMQVAVRYWEEIWTISVQRFEELTMPRWEWLLRTVARPEAPGGKSDER